MLRSPVQKPWEYIRHHSSCAITENIVNTAAQQGYSDCNSLKQRRYRPLNRAATRRLLRTQAAQRRRTPRVRDPSNITGLRPAGHPGASTTQCRQSNSASGSPTGETAASHISQRSRQDLVLQPTATATQTTKSAESTLKTPTQGAVARRSTHLGCWKIL
ncbi:uncharacterized protein N7500_007581 [Penicillium coprophilum]|uniref:uncharacterized protein n=1 Tax=Penicillium coprophilum TaxID=36646 RepID=UPI0023948CA5|nr:uncharacterized protein N7500_007581 [Penicillium coprophilum]KAJ5165751.1 hypothetical protein N7500_007581 [Penicillium coprophilum]